MSSFSFETIRPYLPTVVANFKTIVWDKKFTDLDKADKTAMLNVAVAVGGYLLARNYAGKASLNLLQVAALTTLVNSDIAKLAIGGHLVFFGTKVAISAGRARNPIAFIEAVGLAALGYFANTSKIRDLTTKYVYNKL